MGEQYSKQNPEPTCSNCKFGVDVKNAVVCQRYPPFPVLMRGETYDPGDTLQGFWPRVSPEEKCGEHTPQVTEHERG